MKSLVLDVRGEECPRPLVKMARMLAELGKNEELVILTDIEECVRLIRETAEMLNVRFTSVERMKGYWRITVKV